VVWTIRWYRRLELKHKPEPETFKHKERGWALAQISAWLKLSGTRGKVRAVVGHLEARKTGGNEATLAYVDDLGLIATLDEQEE